MEEGQSYAGGTNRVVKVNIVSFRYIIKSEELGVLILKLLQSAFVSCAAVLGGGFVVLATLFPLLDEEVESLVEECVKVLDLLAVDDSRALNQECSLGGGGKRVALSAC